ncbi:VOC family protein [Chelatococcus reniformis]|uniref:VOC domain-containing protein n=1 Tax=Chelatococcus reniformis TaxID=1494448 RepID=A0A916X6T7_9HYPH|nr:VOC family protein [Chelatococcus reniformis]GGC47858.1 hypothetical protein GCM10010994_03760 [Chelatococcus reniformis]
MAKPSLTAADTQAPLGSASLQLAFKVAAPQVDQCAAELVRHGVELVTPPADRAFGHRTLYFRDPDANLLEVFADIKPRPELPSANVRDRDAKRDTGNGLSLPSAPGRARARTSLTGMIG